MARTTYGKFITEVIQGGKTLHRDISYNKLTYQGAELLIRALVNQPPFQVTHLYARFQASSSAHCLTGGSEMVAVPSTFTTAAASTAGALVTPVFGSPALSSENAGKYVLTGNIATFQFRLTPASTVISSPGGSTFTAASSYISDYALVCAQSYNDRTQDLLLAAAMIVTPFQIPSDAQVIATYVFTQDADAT